MADFVCAKACPILPNGFPAFIFLCYSNFMAYIAQPSQRHAYKRLFYLLVFSTVIMLLGGGVASLDRLGSYTPAMASPTDGLSVVGPPSLSASTVNAIFTRLGSPMAGTGNVVEQASRNTQIDDAFGLAVWWTETNDGEAGTGRPYGNRNPAGVRDGGGYPAGAGGYTIYPSYAAAIVYWFNMIRNRYVDRGLTTVYAISYPYVGTSSSYLWAAKVTRLMLQYRGEAPPPTAIPTGNPTPKPIVSPVVPVKSKQHIRPTENDARDFAKHTQVRPHTDLAPARDATALHSWIDSGLMLFALLAVLVGVTWAVRMMLARRSKPTVPVLTPATIPYSKPLRTTSSLLPSYEPLGSYASQPLYYSGTLAAPTTEELSVDTIEVIPQSLPSVSRETDPRIRRVKLVPSVGSQSSVGTRSSIDPQFSTVPRFMTGQKTPVTREPVAVGTRPAGLLTRYREMQNS